MAPQLPKKPQEPKRGVMGVVGDIVDHTALAMVGGSPLAGVISQLKGDEPTKYDFQAPTYLGFISADNNKTDDDQVTPGTQVVGMKKPTQKIV